MRLHVFCRTISDRRKSTAATMSSMKQGSHTHISDTDKFTVTSQAGETIGDQESQIGTTKSTIGEEATQIPELLKQGRSVQQGNCFCL